MVTTENIDPLLMALRNYGVKRARFYPDGGVEELEFEDAIPEAEPAAPQMTQLVALGDSAARVVDGDVAQRPGYAALFGAEAPRFRPAEG